MRQRLRAAEPVLVSAPAEVAAALQAEFAGCAPTVTIIDSARFGTELPRLAALLGAWATGPARRLRVINAAMNPAAPRARGRAGCGNRSVLVQGPGRVEARALCLCTRPFACAVPLSDPPAGAGDLGFDSCSDLPRIRDLVRIHAERAGLPATRVAELAVASGELATNSLRHGGNRGRVWVWSDRRAICCQVTDSGTIADPAAGLRRPADPAGGRGLWLADQLCDLTERRSDERGTTTRVRIHLPAAGHRRTG